MTKHLTEEQRQYIEKAIDELNPPAASRDQAFRNAAREVGRWKSQAVFEDRNEMRRQLVNDADKLDEIQKIWQRLYPPTAHALVHENSYPDGVIPEIDEKEEALLNRLYHRAERCRRAAENLPRRRTRSRKDSDLDRVWQHTVEQFDKYRPNASDADKRAYADLIHNAKTGSKNLQSWDHTKRKFNKRRSEAISK